MACRTNVRYYLTNNTNSLMYGYMKDGQLGMIFNVPWLKPYLFHKVTKAREIARTNGFSVRYWPGKIYRNSVNMNKM